MFYDDVISVSIKGTPVYIWGGRRGWQVSSQEIGADWRACRGLYY